MKTYIGTKIIQAQECNEFDFMQQSGRDTGSVNIDSLGKSREGYVVRYPDGYTSWSPKDVFEQAYRLISDKEKNLINQ